MRFLCSGGNKPLPYGVRDAPASNIIIVYSVSVKVNRTSRTSCPVLMASAMI